MFATTMGVSTKPFDNELGPEPLDSTMIIENLAYKLQCPDNPANSMIDEDSITDSMSNDEQHTFRRQYIEDNVMDLPKLAKDSK